MQENEHDSETNKEFDVICYVCMYLVYLSLIPAFDYTAPGKQCGTVMKLNKVVAGALSQT